MNISLEEYIESNKQLQEAIHCAKAQIEASKRTKVEDNDSEVLETFIENEEELDEIWRGPSSKQTFLSINPGEHNFDEMYKQLNRNLKKIDFKDENKQSNIEYDLRQVLDANKLEHLPSTHSQQWRLREPNIVEARPAGMPPLVPVSLLDKETHIKKPKKVQWNTYNYKNHGFRKSYRTNFNNNGRPNNQRHNSRFESFVGKNNSASLNNSNASYCISLNENMHNDNKKLNSSLQIGIPTNMITPIANVVAVVGTSDLNGINLIPVGTVFNDNRALLNASLPNSFAFGIGNCLNNGGLNMNPVGYNGQQLIGLNSGYLNNGSLNNLNEAEVSVGRGNLNGIRDYGGIRTRNSQSSGQSNQFLRRALNLTLSSVDKGVGQSKQNKNNENDNLTMHVDENPDAGLMQQDVTKRSLSTMVEVLKDLFKEGIKIKFVS